MKNNLKALLKKRRLVIAFQNGKLVLLKLEGKEPIASQSILLRETPLEDLSRQAASFLNGERVSETVLLLERSEVLQKELVLSGKDHGSFKHSLAESVEALLPCSPKEMAYGLALETRGEEAKGVLLALPEKYVQEKLLFLNQLGLRVDEIVTEDQALCWLLAEKGEMGAVLFLLKEEGRILSVFVKGGTLVFSRSFDCREEGGEFLAALSLSFLERRERPDKVLLSGSWDLETQSQVLRHFEFPVEQILIPELGGKRISPVLYGASFFGKYPAISLLPTREKIAKRIRERKRILREAGLSFALFLGSLLIAFTLHGAGRAWEIKRMEGEIRRLRPQVQAVEKMAESLAFFAESEASKIKLLDLLKELSAELPSSISFRELRIEGRDFLFKGECPSHAFLAETVQAIQATGLVQGAKLDQTRLRKRLNQDYFEFEISGQWTV